VSSGQWRSHEDHLAYMRKYHRTNWERLRAASSERGKAWRARKERQMQFVEKYLTIAGVDFEDLR
jgi:hypothetical protein